MKTPKLYDSTRHPVTAANIWVVGSLSILVHRISQEAVWFVLNPNLQSFSQGKRAQEVSFTATDDTIMRSLTPASAPIQVSAAGARYEVSLAEIGTESMEGVLGRLDYCIFEVTSLPSPGAAN